MLFFQSLVSIIYKYLRVLETFLGHICLSEFNTDVYYLVLLLLLLSSKYKKMILPQSKLYCTDISS